MKTARIALIILAAFALPASALQTERYQDRPTPESTRHYLEGRLAERLGQAAVDSGRRAATSIMVFGAYGEFPSHVPAGVLVRTRAGWASHEGGRVQPLPAEVGRALDMILADPAFWAEDSFAWEQPCTGGARLMVVRHQRREKVARQPCGPSGLAGRLSEIAANRMVPLPRPAEVEPPPPPRRIPPPQDEREYPTQDPEVPGILWQKTLEAARGWNWGDFEAFLAPYAEDVVMVWPTGMEYGKPALRERARGVRAWNGRQADRRMEVRTASVRQLSPHAVIQTTHIWYAGAGLPDTQIWITSIWQNRRGEWEVTHEQVGQEVPGHGR